MSSYKHDRALPPPEEPRVPPGRKDTKRWCRGKVGVEHQLHWQPKDWGFDFSSFTVKVCSVCGKGVAYCFGKRGKKGCRCGHHDQKPRVR